MSLGVKSQELASPKVVMGGLCLQCLFCVANPFYLSSSRPATAFSTIRSNTITFACFPSRNSDKADAVSVAGSRQDSLLLSYQYNDSEWSKSQRILIPGAEVS